jgi:hypothetical protein
MMNTNALNSYVYSWRRERDSVSRLSFGFSNLQILNCQECQECRHCRGPLPLFAPEGAKELSMGLPPLCGKDGTGRPSAIFGVDADSLFKLGGMACGS